MEKKELSYIPFIQREEEERQLKSLLLSFSALSNEQKKCAKKGIYIYGESGVGKSYFVRRCLEEMNYDVVSYNTGTIRNKSLFENITSDNMSSYSVLSLLKKTPRKIAIVIDDINSMNGDKGSHLTTLIKIIRAKKTKKHKGEDTSINPIICIGNGIANLGKKLLELVKSCDVIQLKRPTTIQMKKLLQYKYADICDNDMDTLTYYIQNDLNKLNIIMKLYVNNPDILKSPIFREMFHLKTNNHDNRTELKIIYNQCPKIKDHTTIIRNSEQTTMGLYWHENVPDIIQLISNNNDAKGNVYTYTKNKIYLEILNNICFADYIDRFMFQKQIWKLKEMTSLIKTFKTQTILAKYTSTSNISLETISKLNIRFTKVLTKYTNEFNNFTFIQILGNKLSLDIKDILAFFIYLKHTHSIIQTNDNAIINPLECYNISCTDIKRMYKYLIRYLTFTPNVVDVKDDNNDECEEDDENCDMDEPFDMMEEALEEEGEE